MNLRHVYLIRHGDLYKIGLSGCPEVRFGQVVPRGEGVLVHTFASARATSIETALHRRFASCHVRGEWFRLSAGDVASICLLGRTDTADDLPASLQPAESARSRCCLGPNAVPTVPLRIRVPQDVLDALDRLVGLNHRTRTQEIALAIEDRLRAHGLWPDGRQS